MFAEDVFTQLFGQDATPANVVASFIMYMFGAGVVFAIEVVQRDKRSDRTPYNFNLFFLIGDNWARILLTVLIGNIVIILGANVTFILGFTMPDAIGRYAPLVAGLFSDSIALSIKRKFIKTEVQINAQPSS